MSLPKVVLDAGAVMDYLDWDPGLIHLVTSRVWTPLVPRPVLEVLTDVAETTAVALGFRVVRPDDALLEAVSARRSQLSFEDRLCLVVAKELGVPCVTSDPRLRAECRAARIHQLEVWEPLINLVELGAMTMAGGHRAAESMRERNEQITAVSLRDFGRRLRSAARRAKQTSAHK